jgi:hypothetical protein
LANSPQQMKLLRQRHFEEARRSQSAIKCTLSTQNRIQ